MGNSDDSRISNICVAFFSTPFQITIVLRSMRDNSNALKRQKNSI